MRDLGEMSTGLGACMTAVGDDSTHVTDSDVDAIAWQFLNSDHPHD
jgi:hypothetical protein